MTANYNALKLHDVMSDIVSTIDSHAQWDNDFGSKPRGGIKVTYDKRVRGLATNVNENIIVYADAENIRPWGIGGTDYWHDILVTIEVNTNVSEDRFNVLVGAVVHIIKANIKKSGYIHWLVKGFNNNSHKGRNYWSGTIDVLVQLTDPTQAFS